MKRWLLLPAAFILSAFFLFHEEINSPENLKLEIGDVVDSLNGVVVYYNGSVSNVSGRHIIDGYNVGLKYQCVEFVKRYYYQHYNHKMPNSYGHAKDFFNKNLNDGELNPDRDLIQYKNPSTTPPRVGDLLVMDGNTFNPYGHVAIISQISDDEIEIIQQNPGPAAPSRINIDLSSKEGNWKLNRSDILGWLRLRP